MLHFSHSTTPMNPIALFLVLYLLNHLSVGLVRAQLRHRRYRYLKATHFGVSLKRRMFRSGTFLWAIFFTASEYLLLYPSLLF